MDIPAPAPGASPPSPHTAAGPGLEAARHVVDALIEERAQKLMARPWAWALIKAVIYPLFGYRKAVRIADMLAPLSGPGAMDWASSYLDMTVDARDIERVPRSGGVVVVANHPGGIADGVATWDALKDRRSDICYFANRDALRVCPGLESVIIPVEWREEHRTREKTRETLRLAIEAFKAERCVVVFPAGRMAEFSWVERALKERAWMPTAVSLARKFGAPIVPLGVAQRLSLVYYAFAQINDELKNMTVFHELLAKRGARYALTFGEAIDSHTLPSDETDATNMLRAICEELAWEHE